MVFGQLMPPDPPADPCECKHNECHEWRGKDICEIPGCIHYTVPEMAYDMQYGASCGGYCSSSAWNGCDDNHPTGYWELEGPSFDSDGYGPVMKYEDEAIRLVASWNYCRNMSLEELMKVTGITRSKK